MTTNLPTRRCARAAAAFLAIAFSSTLPGCGNAPPQAAVKGTITYMGSPVTGGTLIFGPVGSGNIGQPASATVHPDGTFVLGTSRAADGALIGRHRVTFTPPPQDLTEQQRSDPDYIAPPPPFMGMVPKTAEVEVKAGQNTIDIELTPAQ